MLENLEALDPDHVESSAYEYLDGAVGEVVCHRADYQGEGKNRVTHHVGEDPACRSAAVVLELVLDLEFSLRHISMPDSSTPRAPCLCILRAC